MEALDTIVREAEALEAIRDKLNAQFEAFAKDLESTDEAKMAAATAGQAKLLPELTKIEENITKKWNAF